MINVLVVAVGAAVGAPLRYLIDRWVNSRRDFVFPAGTLVVNIAGSFLLGLLTGVAIGTTWFALLGNGLCGAFTTYSTFSYETLRLAESGAGGIAVTNVVGSILAGLAAATAGVALGMAV